MASCLTLLAMGLFASLLQSCASKAYESVPRASAGTLQSVDLGTVVAVKPVTIDGERTYVGPSAGGVVGSAIGQTVGRGDGRILAAAAGAAAGGIVGGMLEEEMTEKQAQELTISMDDGGTVVVVQELKQPEFIAGDRVKVMANRVGDARVSHADYSEDGLY